MCDYIDVIYKMVSKCDHHRLDALHQSALLFAPDAFSHPLLWSVSTINFFLLPWLHHLLLPVYKALLGKRISISCQHLAHPHNNYHLRSTDIITVVYSKLLLDKIPFLLFLLDSGVPFPKNLVKYSWNNNKTKTKVQNNLLFSIFSNCK